MKKNVRKIKPLTWPGLVAEMYLSDEDEETSLYLSNNLKIRLDRKPEEEDGDEYVSYRGILMRNIAFYDGEEDWRVATAVMEDPIFHCKGEDELFDAIIRLLEKIKKDTLMFYIRISNEQYAPIAIHLCKDIDNEEEK